MNKLWKLTGALSLAAAVVTASAAVARDPAYQAARASGQIGELRNGYLGVVSSSDPSVRRMVEELNIQRREVYTLDARKVDPPATLEAYALTGGCINIARTQPGEKYEGLDGSWQTRTSAPPIRDPRCPAWEAKNRK